jgi:hypothetical protein
MKFVIQTLTLMIIGVSHFAAYILLYSVLSGLTLTFNGSDVLYGVSISVWMIGYMLIAYGLASAATVYFLRRWAGYGTRTA